MTTLRPTRPIAFRHLASRVAMALLLATTAVVGLTAAPAAAGVVVTSSGTIVTAAITGDATFVRVECISTTVWVGGTQATPPVACASLTKVVVTGDAGKQVVDATTLTTATFPALSSFEASMGDGADTVVESPRPDEIDLGPGDDMVTFIPGGSNAGTFDGGTGNDRAYVFLPAGNDTVTTLSTFTSVAVTMSGTPSSTRLLTSAERLQINGNDGNDSLSVAGVTAGSTLADISVFGGNGNDTLVGGGKFARLYGDAGTNQMQAGSGGATMSSTSRTDTLLGGSGPNGFVDEISRDFGGRTIIPGISTNESWSAPSFSSDAVLRLRRASGGNALVTSSLARRGQQTVPAGIEDAYLSTGLGVAASGSVDRSLVDVQTWTGHAIVVTGDGDDTLDVTVPSGTWTVTTEGANQVITLADGVTRVLHRGIGAVDVHLPRTGNEGFVQRVIRDLQFRFPSASERNGLRDQLNAGTRTRAQVIATLMDTDTYRGIDVDRVFRDVLQRLPDAGGRTYWIGRLDTGIGVRELRANLLGSNEYYNWAGGTNSSWLRAAYKDVLGREPDSAGLAYWDSVLTAGTSRGSVTEQFLLTGEARRRMVSNQFLRFLDRLPTTTELDSWTKAAAADDGEEQVVAFLAGSSTYFSRT